MLSALKPQRLSLTSLSSPPPLLSPPILFSRRAMKCAAAAEDDGGRMVDAAEALAGMAMCSRPHHVAESVVISHQDRPVVAEGQCGYAATTAATSEQVVRHIPTQLRCCTSQVPKPWMKSRRKLTEAEKEERKLRHVMANRESARQTIRRRQAMHQELTRKAAEVLEENEHLKKQKMLVMEGFNSIKKRNEFLRGQLAEVKKVLAREREEELSSCRAKRVCSATTTPSIFQPPSMVPCFLPSMVPSSDAFPFQCATHPHHMSQPSVFPFQCATHPHHITSPQFPMPPGEEHSIPTPYVVVPLPWLLPFLTHASTSGANTTRPCEKCSCSCSRHSEDNQSMQNIRAEANSQSSSRRTPAGITVPGLFSPVRRQEDLEPSRAFQAHDTAVSAHGSVGDGLFQINQEKPDDFIASTEARKRRKELMRLKNINFK